MCSEKLDVVAEYLKQTYHKRVTRPVRDFVEPGEFCPDHESNRVLVLLRRPHQLWANADEKVEIQTRMNYSTRTRSPFKSVNCSLFHHMPRLMETSTWAPGSRQPELALPPGLVDSPPLSLQQRWPPHESKVRVGLASPFRSRLSPSALSHQ